VDKPTRLSGTGRVALPMIDIQGQRLKEYQIVGREVVFCNNATFLNAVGFILDISPVGYSVPYLEVERPTGGKQALLVNSIGWWSFA
jgi:hypothetical protein